VLFAACNEDETALEDPNTRHGLFTHAVLHLLQAGEGQTSVLGVADEVQRIVRAEAARMGYVQTPVIFGHVTGEVTIPVLRPGVNYSAAFPTRALQPVSSDLADLAPYGIPQPVIDAWSAKFPAGLNELQKTAINQFGVLNGDSLLVVAPTSAGKTFVGELAAMKAVAEGKKAVFLLPYRALVNEKYEDFSDLYGARIGLRVARCSGDWQDQVPNILRGKYDIAFFTYETFLSLALNARHILHQIGLVILDEAQFLSDAHRGITVELLLTLLLNARASGIAPQLICLSAVIGGANALDQWLGCQLLSTTERPVPLVEGVLDRQGQYQAMMADGTIDRNQLLPSHAIRLRREKPSSQDIIVPLVRHLVASGEKILIFRNTRGSAQGCANYLAEELGLPAASDVINAMPELDPTTRSAELQRCLQGGTAFHSTDLRKEERRLVENAFRAPNGSIQVLVATSTVAAGINTPATSVIVVETEFFGEDAPVPYTVAGYKNMAGRAGLDAQFTFTRPELTSKVLRSALVGMHVYYAAIEHIRHEKNERIIFAAVCLVRYNPRDREGYIFGYKDMDETVGPNESGCPEAILDLLTPTKYPYAKAWRARCRENLAARRLLATKSSPCPGQTIVFDKALSFSDGRKLDRFEVVANPRSHRIMLFRAMDTGGLYRIRNVKKLTYRLIDPG
jgi:hypothetical protein